MRRRRWRSDKPESADACRDALYCGDIFQWRALPGSLRLAEMARAALQAALGTIEDRDSKLVTTPGWFERMGQVRRSLYLDPDIHSVVRKLLGEAGWDPDTAAFDPPRLRVICSGGHHLPAAAPVYALHRDTWYSHPAALVTWWVPLDDLPADQTFVVYPQMLDVPVSNSSERFDYATWVAGGWVNKVGWQNPRTGLEEHYPRGEPAVNVLDGFGPEVGFACRRGDNLLFSGAQLHRTLPHEAGRTRYSLDFRVVHLADIAVGRGAPMVDNRSIGTSVDDYVYPGRLWRPRMSLVG